jgi:predicted CXXCH cytochrome family protein
MQNGCMNCHTPHASNVEHLLIRMPFDLCVNCHSRDDSTDHDGRKLMNFKKWLDQNPVWHAPVASKDCSACHLPHGGDKFRLLVSEYPAEFYAPYDPKNYQLCFECHNPKVLSEPETTTLTKFRDGSKNLHFLHVNKPDNGRTCRACHEVHAARQPHHIRDAVPYGQKRWMLPINYTPSPSGGSCEKTCHGRKDYDNGGGRGVAASKPAIPKK